jgi:putative transposase
VGSVLAEAEQDMEKRYRLRSRGYDLAKVGCRVSELLGGDPGAVWRKGRYRVAVKAWSLFCYWEVRELGTPMSLLARKLEIPIAPVSQSAARGRSIGEGKPPFDMTPRYFLPRSLICQTFQPPLQGMS